jgi:hypothetical protein
MRREGIGKAYALENMFGTKNETRMAAALYSTAVIFRVSKFVAFWRRITSSMRGCSQPEVVLGVVWAPVGVRGEDGVAAAAAAG